MGAIVDTADGQEKWENGLRNKCTKEAFTEKYELFLA